jgi:hypothetical protein
MVTNEIHNQESKYTFPQGRFFEAPILYSFKLCGMGNMNIQTQRFSCEGTSIS